MLTVDTDNVPGVPRVSCEADLIVDDNVDGTVGCVRGEIAQMESFVNHSLRIQSTLWRLDAVTRRYDSANIYKRHAGKIYIATSTFVTPLITVKFSDNINTSPTIQLRLR